MVRIFIFTGAFLLTSAMTGKFASARDRHCLAETIPDEALQHNPDLRVRTPWADEAIQRKNRVGKLVPLHWVEDGGTLSAITLDTPENRRLAREQYLRLIEKTKGFRYYSWAFDDDNRDFGAGPKCRSGNNCCVGTDCDVYPTCDPALLGNMGDSPVFEYEEPGCYRFGFDNPTRGGLTNQLKSEGMLAWLLFDDEVACREALVVTEWIEDRRRVGQADRGHAQRNDATCLSYLALDEYDNRPYYYNPDGYWTNDPDVCGLTTPCYQTIGWQNRSEYHRYACQNAYVGHNNTAWTVPFFWYTHSPVGETFTRYRPFDEQMRCTDNRGNPVSWCEHGFKETDKIFATVSGVRPISRVFELGATLSFIFRQMIDLGFFQEPNAQGRMAELETFALYGDSPIYGPEIRREKTADRLDRWTNLHLGSSYGRQFLNEAGGWNTYRGGVKSWVYYSSDPTSVWDMENHLKNFHFMHILSLNFLLQQAYGFDRGTRQLASGDPANTLPQQWKLRAREIADWSLEIGYDPSNGGTRRGTGKFMPLYGSGGAFPPFPRNGLGCVEQPNLQIPHRSEIVKRFPLERPNGSIEYVNLQTGDFPTDLRWQHDRGYQTVCSNPDGTWKRGDGTDGYDCGSRRTCDGWNEYGKHPTPAFYFMSGSKKAKMKSYLKWLCTAGRVLPGRIPYELIYLSFDVWKEMLEIPASEFSCSD